MNLKPRNPDEDGVLQRAKQAGENLVKAVEEVKELGKKVEDLKPTAIKIMEEILLGTRTPVQGMKIDIKLKDAFPILGSKSTKDSFFRYTYPLENGVAVEDDELEKTEDAKDDEAELDVPII